MESDVLPVNASCNGVNDGQATASITGGTGPYSYLWSNGHTTANPTNLAAGTYTVTISDVYGNDVIDTVTITQPPALTSILTVTNETCAGNGDGAIDLTPGGGMSGFTYIWSTGDQVQDVMALTAGTYYVTITDSTGCSRVDSATVGVTNPTPVANAGPDQDVCATSAQLAATPPSFGQGTWSFVVTGGGSITNLNSPTSTVTGLAPGEHVLSWAVQSGPCIASDTVEIYVSYATVVDAGADTTICATGFTLSGSNPGNGSGIWTALGGPASFSNATDPSSTVSGLMPGNYQFIWSVNDANCTATDTMHMLVGAAPVSAFNSNVAGFTVTFTDLSQNAAWWSWDFDDGNTSTQQNPVHTYAVGGTYNVCLTVGDTCGTAASCNQVFIVPVGIQGASSEAFEVYPNPTTGRASLALSGFAADRATAMLYDIDGRLVRTLDLTLVQGAVQAELDLSALADGMYLLRLRAGDRHFSRKILKTAQ